MTDNKNIDDNLLFHRESILHHLVQSVDGAIFQGNRTIEAFNPRESSNAAGLEYTFNKERFELSLYLQCLEIVVLMVESFRCNTQESGLRFDDLQPVKGKIEKSINTRLLSNTRNAWLHPEKTLLGKLRDSNVSKDVVNHGVPAYFWVQVVNGEILVSDRKCARHDENYNIVWLTYDFISVQQTIRLLEEVRTDILGIVAKSCFYFTVTKGQSEERH